MKADADRGGCGSPVDDVGLGVHHAVCHRAGPGEIGVCKEAVLFNVDLARMHEVDLSVQAASLIPPAGAVVARALVAIVGVNKPVSMVDGMQWV